MHSPNDSVRRCSIAKKGSASKGPAPADLASRPAQRDPCTADLAEVREALDGSAPARERLAVRLACVAKILVAQNRRFGLPLDSEELRDLAQDTIAVIWSKFSDYRGDAPLQCWWYSFCRNGLANAMRSKRRRLAVIVSGDGPSPLAWNPRHSVVELIRVAIARLTRSRTAVVRLRVIDGLSFAEIAERLAVPAATARTWFHRSVAELRAALAVHLDAPRPARGRATSRRCEAPREADPGSAASAPTPPPRARSGR